MASWTIVERKEVREGGNDVRFVFVCERDGARHEATVSPVAWASYKAGDPIELSGVIDSVALRVEGVQLRVVEGFRTAQKHAYYAQMRPFRGISVPTWPISKELYETLVRAGARELKG
jgi:hypothetical protein